MRDYNRKFRPGHGDRPHDHLPHVVNSFKIEADDNWRGISRIDDDGWVDIPVPTQADIDSGRLILIQVRHDNRTGFRILDKEKFNSLVDRISSPEALERETGIRDKSEFFCCIDAVEYHPDGKVKLTYTHINTLSTEGEVELRSVKGDLEIHRPEH